MDNESKQFVVTPKEDKAVVMTIRIDRTLQERYDKLANESNRSRNELMNMALEFAIENLEFLGKKD